MTNLRDKVESWIIQQYKDTNLVDLIMVYVEAFQEVQDVIDYFTTNLDVDVAEGAWLDLIGTLVGMARGPEAYDPTKILTFAAEFQEDLSPPQYPNWCTYKESTGEGGVFPPEGGIYAGASLLSDTRYRQMVINKIQANISNSSLKDIWSYIVGGWNNVNPVFSFPSANELLIDMSPENVIANGDFETDIDGWTDTSTPAAEARWAASDQSLIMEVYNSYGVGRAEYSVSNVPPGKYLVYLITKDTMGSGAPSDTNVFTVTDSDSAIVLQQNVPPNYTKYGYVYFFDVSDTTNLTFKVEFNGTTFQTVRYHKIYVCPYLGQWDLDFIRRTVPVEAGTYVSVKYLPDGKE